MNMFEKASSNDHQMSLAGVGRGPTSDVGEGGAEAEVQCHMGTPVMRPVKTLPCRKGICGR